MKQAQRLHLQSAFGVFDLLPQETVSFSAQFPAIFRPNLRYRMLKQTANFAGPGVSV